MCLLEWRNWDGKSGFAHTVRCARLVPRQLPGHPGDRGANLGPAPRAAYRGPGRRQATAGHFELSSDELGRLHGPVALRIGAKTVAVMTQIVEVKNAQSVAPWPVCAAVTGA